jgi:adenylate cyclase
MLFTFDPAGENVNDARTVPPALARAYFPAYACGMQNVPRRARSLTFKVDILLIVALAVGIGAVMAAFAISLVAFRDGLTRESLLSQGGDHFIAIETLMLSGNAPEAVGYFSKVKLISALTTITLYRRDGTPAFSDNTTIERVNTVLKKNRFSLRDRPAQPGKAPPKPRFAEAAGLPPQEVFFRDDEGSPYAGGAAYFRAYRPLVNLPKCTVCHGTDHTVRGVIDIRSDVTGMMRSQAVTSGAVGAGFLAVVALLAVIIGSFLRRVVLNPVQAIAKVCAAVAAGDFRGRVAAESNDEIGALGRTVNTMVGGLRERFELTKYVSASTIGSLQAGQEPRRVARSLLFTDVRGFTAYAERRPPEQVVAVLNRLLEQQAEIIQGQGGDIDKFVGDEVVAVFSGDDGTRRACAAAMRIVHYCRSRSAELDGLAVGIGISTGPVIHGMIGSARRADFTVIGDPVNVASRLCAMAKALQVVVTDAAKERAGDAFRFAGPYSVKLKGRSEPARVWQLAGLAVGRRR